MCEHSATLPLPGDQLAVLETLYEWCHVGRRQVTNPGPPDGEISYNLTMEFVPGYLVCAELCDTVPNAESILAALQREGFIAREEEHYRAYGIWDLPDGRRMTAKYAGEAAGQTAEESSSLGAVSVSVGNYTKTVIIPPDSSESQPAVYTLTPKGIACAKAHMSGERHKSLVGA